MTEMPWTPSIFLDKVQGLQPPHRDDHRPLQQVQQTAQICARRRHDSGFVSLLKKERGTQRSVRNNVLLPPLKSIARYQRRTKKHTESEILHNALWR